ncbi:MAG: integrase arm-type DNA-binding domain-containing protein [Azonexus sp.]|nr:integrase arm-type DNA-binding domain-containing protein [Azonexus sp.]MCK6411488.1 integrase arm-type DNA-binding domain-containing protein [Azonexus sp.]
MPLTDIVARNAKAREKPYKLSDTNGLFLLVKPNGTKLWQQKYRFMGKEKLLSHGQYPETGLKDARARRDQARKLLAEGIDPSEHKKAAETPSTDTLGDCFEEIGREWLKHWGQSIEPAQLVKATSRLEKDVFPWLGCRPIASITAPDILETLRRIEQRGAAYTAMRAKSEISRIFRFAVVTGRADRDPVPDLRGALRPARFEHFASITDPQMVGELLRAMDGFRGTFVVKCALLLSPLLFPRPGELRQAEWSDIDLEKGEWRYLITKTKTDHLVPLSSQAVTILRELHPLTGRGRYVFPGRDPKKPMSNMTLNAALRRLGYDTKNEITGHGFRAMARTILHEELQFPPEVIEHQLGHKVPDALGQAYNRTKFIRQRREMMQAWADYLERLKSGAQVIDIRSRA